MPTGDVELTILDGGGSTVVVPSASIQVCIGTTSTGTPAVVTASRSPNTLTTNFGVGPGIDQASTTINAGGTALFMKCATTTAGTVNKRASTAITAVSLAAVITSTAHGLTTGDVVTVSGVTGATEVNVTGIVTVLTSATFTINGITAATAYVSGGTCAHTGVQQLNSGTSVCTVTGAPNDAYLFKLLVTAAGTTGTSGIRFKLSADAGRTYGPEIALGTAITYAVSGTGVTLNFVTATTMLLGGTITFACTEPLPGVADIQACLVALEASPYSSSGWGSMHIGGVWTGAQAATIQGYLDTMVTTKTFTRAILNVRDASYPATYGGTGESDATWSAAVALDVSAVSAKRICLCAGNYNMASNFPIGATGLPILRRPASWALAARQVTLAPQNHAGRVSDGSLAQVIVDPTTDATDGFVYHDDYLAPVLDVARLTSLRRRKGRGGFYIKNPNLMSPAGSVFTLLPLGNVMDIGCALLDQANTDFINSDIRLNNNGTIAEDAAQLIERRVNGVLRDRMFARSMISDFSYAIDRTNNVRTTSTVNFTATLYSRGYILEIDGTVGFGQDGG